MEYWAIEVYSDNDYCAWELNIPKVRETFWDKKEQFNQKLVDKYGCVYHAGYWALNDNYQWELNHEENLKELEALKKDYWYVEWSGMYVYKGVDMVRNWRNKKFPDDPVITYRVTIWSAEYHKYIKLWYSIHNGYSGNKKYNADKADWVLDNIEFWATTYGHSVRDVYNDKINVVDNYVGIKTNIYEIKDLQWLVDNDVKHNNWYIYIFKKKIMTKLEIDIALIQQAVDFEITYDLQLLEDIKKGNYTVMVRVLIFIMRSRSIVLL